MNKQKLEDLMTIKAFVGAVHSLTQAIVTELDPRDLTEEGVNGLVAAVALGNDTMKALERLGWDQDKLDTPEYEEMKRVVARKGTQMVADAMGAGEVFTAEGDLKSEAEIRSQAGQNDADDLGDPGESPGSLVELWRTEERE